jgi:F-type H+-transporting ATPase subunit epsilon
MNSWRSAGVSYLKYAETCAQALRNVLKDEPKAIAQKRAGNSLKVQRWEKGKAGESQFVVEQKSTTE